MALPGRSLSAPEKGVAMKNLTLPELVAKTDREFYNIAEVCGVLHADPQTLRLTARQRPELLGFPVIITGNRVKIPRLPFLRYMGVII